MPSSLAEGLTAEHVLKALADLDRGITHPFGPSIRYELFHEGKRYPPKAVVGLAVKHSTGRIIGPEDFSAGEAPGQANYILRKLGFTVILKGTPAVSSPDGPATGELLQASELANESGYFSTDSLKDERERQLREIVARRGQPHFRNQLLAAYGGACAVTDCDAPAALEAAHIVPYCGPQSNHITNGLLLRADIHTLFDLDLIGVDPATYTVSVAPAIRETRYAEFHGRKLRVPAAPEAAPDREALAQRWQRFTLGG